MQKYVGRPPLGYSQVYQVLGYIVFESVGERLICKVVGPTTIVVVGYVEAR